MNVSGSQGEVQETAVAAPGNLQWNFSGPTPDLLSEIRWRWGPVTGVLTWVSLTHAQVCQPSM